MKFRLLIPVILAALVVHSSYAQEDYAFKVLVNKGQNAMKSGNAWEPLKVGTKLKAIDEVKLSANAYLGLVHVSGKPLELKDPGTHKVANLAARIKPETNVMNKFADFVLTSTEGRKSTLAATGAVTRGVMQVKLLLPTSSTYVFSDSLAVAWTSATGVSGPYVVTLTSLFGDVLKTMEATDTVAILNLSDEPLRGENDISVTVHPKANKNRISEGVALRRFSPNDRERIIAQYNEFAPVVAEKTAFNQWILAKFFEDRKLIADAASALQQAIRLAPDVADYREDYEAFLLRNNLKPRTP